MSKSTHTPYPWFVVEMQPRKHTTARRYLIQSGEANICTLDVAGRDTSRDEANAHLIAASPDLLAACKAARSLLSKLGGKNHDPEFSELEAAIAKAEGE